jgi:hypothetical protein
MGYWAKLDNNRIVTEVIVASEEVISSGAFGLPQNWIETSITEEFRYNYAGIGYTYDLVANAFIAPKPYPDAILDTTTYKWDITPCFPSSGSF